MSLEKFNEKMDNLAENTAKAGGRVGDGFGFLVQAVLFVFILCLAAGFAPVFLRPWLPDWAALIYGLLIGFIVVLVANDSRWRWIAFFVTFAGLTGSWFLPVQ
ncbi:hypothetical protein AB0N89_20375 [Amycolatopsis sp. NPDC089917]|uniref:hypothetical protein n=1 Tax=Amycolatopsis sp. NPDC089917 TaxID=3155187 RepID=UPI003449A6AF